MFCTKRNASALKTYKYKSKDNSFLTTHPYLAYWNYLGRFISPSISPNAITISGFLAILMQTLAVLYLDRTFLGENRLLTGFSSIAMFIYVTCDALDGVQARAIGAGSSFGQLFDHGVDSVTTTLIVLCVSSGIGIACKKAIISLLISCQAIFYWTTLQEYYTGVFTLEILGPTEMILLSCFLLLAIALVGANTLFFFKNRYPKLLKKLVFFSSIIVSCVGTIYYIFCIYKETQFGFGGVRTVDELAYNIASHLVFLSMQGVMLWVAILSKKISFLGMLSFIGLCTLTFSLFTTLAIYSHQLGSLYIEFPILLPILVGLAGLIVSVSSSKFVNFALHCLFIIGLVLYGVSVKDIILESLTALNIPFFNAGPGSRKTQ